MPGKADPPELDHAEPGDPGRGDGYLGMAHRGCNRYAAGLKSAQLAGKPLRQRRCCVCGIPIVVSDGKTRTCGKAACVATLKAARKAHQPDPEPPGATGATGRLW